MPKTNLRILFFVVFIIFMGYAYTINHAEMNLFLRKENVKESTQDYLEKQKKYLVGGRMECITFWAQQAEDSDKKHERHAILYVHPQALGTVLVCHGFMCDKFDIAFMRRILFSDYNVMMFDFRAHGENVDEEQCCTFGRDEALDVIGAVNYLKTREDINHLSRIVYGFSMGAVAAIQAQATDASLFHAMILDCPYDTSESIIKQSLQNLTFSLFGYTFEIPGRQLLERFAFNTYVQTFLKVLLKAIANMDAVSTKTQLYPLNTVVSIKKVNIPCLFIHCKNDEKIPVQAAKNLYLNAGGYKRLWITNGRRHFDSIFYNPEKYVYKINKFMSVVLNKMAEHKPQSKVYLDVTV